MQHQLLYSKKNFNSHSTVICKKRILLSTEKLKIMELIKKTTLDFLNLIKRNNNRDWFLKNRLLYVDARENFESIVQ
ncbi:MAG: DUF2461 family protein, partial [Bacteroidetes bacterium]